MFAEIVVNAPLSRRRVPYLNRTEGFAALAQTFTYSIPAHLAEQLQAGQLVTVPFGARKLQGIVMALADETTVERVKDVYEIVDVVPVLSRAQLELARWLSAYYFAPLIECVLQMFPPGLEADTRTMIALNPDAPRLVNPKQLHVQLVERLRERPLPLDELLRDVRKRETQQAIDALVRRRVLLRQTELLPPRAKEKHERIVRLIAEPSEEVLAALHAPRQLAVLQYLQQRGGLNVVVSARELTRATGASTSTLRALADANFMRSEQRTVWRDPLADLDVPPTEPPTLTDEQHGVWEAIRELLTKDGGRRTAASTSTSVFHLPSAALLFGVTGSGKTEIYLRAVAEVLAQGRQSIVLVPEIALTPQTIWRFAERFPNRLALLHSQLSMGERYDQWRRIRAGEIDVVIGSRSAIFAPLPNLGLIVLDEEHEASYKQDKSPRYHAREVALEYARLTNAMVILGSATPSLETMWKARRGEYRLLELRERIETAGDGRQTADSRPRPIVHHPPSALSRPPSAVEIVDMRAELKAGNTSIFSRALRDGLAQTLAAGEQAILFLNRRGAATFVMCRDCGYVLRCRRCDNPLTYHSDQDDLVCHYCNRRYAQPPHCPNCWSRRIKHFGAGTQKVEELVRQLFPQARALRWDRDVTTAKGAHARLLKKFVAHEADILIGTQMIAKGLDLPLVTLVGVVSADTSLHLPDFRASERTFQLLTQVAGRAGRSRLAGNVIFQTYSPTHPAIVAAAQHDYDAFYENEIQFRAALNYPPLSRLLRLLFVGRGEARARAEAVALHRQLHERIRQLGASDLELIGPAPCFVHKMRGEYRWHVIVKGAEPHELLRDFVLPLGWRVDVDPMDLL